jgi:polyhydroxybutyrate depolymerase
MGEVSGPLPGPTPRIDRPAQQMVSMTLGDRPFTLYVPSSYRIGTALPLLVMLHGYTSSGSRQENYLKIAPEAEARGILYAVPDGTTDTQGDRFWNATNACCNFYGSTVDDSTYLAEVIAAVSARYSVDPARVYLAGHSNGAFMSFRMACEHADLIAAIAVLNGAMLNDMSRCKPSQPVSVLNIRGDADNLIRNGGGQFRGNPYPSTEATVRDWVTLDGCGATPVSSEMMLDLASDVDGVETTMTTYRGCQRNSTVELWTIRDGSHVPAFTANFIPAVLDFLLAQSL